MNIGNRIKKSLVKEMRDLIWAETSKGVNDNPWYNARRLVLLPVDNSVSDSVWVSVRNSVRDITNIRL